MADSLYNVDVAETEGAVRSFVNNEAMQCIEMSCTLVCQRAMDTATTGLAATVGTTHQCELATPATVRRATWSRKDVARRTCSSPDAAAARQSAQHPMPTGPSQ